MPFNNIMLLPTELRLKTTKNGVRLFSIPIKETSSLFTQNDQLGGIDAAAANKGLSKYKDKDRLRIKTTIKLFQATCAGLNLFGQRILDYDMNSNTTQLIILRKQRRCFFYRNTE